VGRKLSLVTPTLYTHNGATESLGGAEKYTRDLAFLCRDLGFETTIRQFGLAPWERLFEGMPVRAYPWNGDQRDCVERLMKPDLDAADHVIYITIGSQMVYKPNSIVINHGIWFDNPNFTRQFGIDVAEQHALPALEQTAAFVTVDLSFLEYCRCVIPHANNNKMIYIPNYVDTDLFRPGERPADDMIEILFPRRYAEPRGIYLMQEIVPDLLQKYPHVRFNFALDKTGLIGEWEAWLRGQTHWERITYHHYPMDTMPEAYRQADIVVIPSIWAEGTSLAALEAMACGKALVCTNVGGLANLILPNFNGKIVNPTAGAVRSALEEYVNSGQERRIHGENARRVAEQSFSKKRWDRQWTEIIYSVFGRS